MAETARLVDFHAFYTLAMREAHAEQFIMAMAEVGKLEITQSRHVGPTYGLEPAFIKSIKAKFRNELSFAGEK
jgi:hypothetical protein